MTDETNLENKLKIELMQRALDSRIKFEELQKEEERNKELKLEERKEMIVRGIGYSTAGTFFAGVAALSGVVATYFGYEGVMDSYRNGLSPLACFQLLGSGYFGLVALGGLGISGHLFYKAATGEPTGILEAFVEKIDQTFIF